MSAIGDSPLRGIVWGFDRYRIFEKVCFRKAEPIFEDFETGSDMWLQSSANPS